VAQLSGFAVWKEGVPMVVFAAASRPSGACLTPSWPATAAAAAWSAAWTAHLAGCEWRPRGAARVVRAANARMVGAVLLDNRLPNQRRNFGLIGRVATLTPRTRVRESSTNRSLSSDLSREFTWRANHESAGPDVLSRPIT
jgi:hypothetical protein